ncbi:MAG TPA: DUF952 domain-containing protein, partial [Gemmataceae bacterium]|nr:DUF952 domain-containing protein [Gemmataceae bacterium]
MAARFLVLLLLLLVCSLGPGLVIVRRLRWGPAEKFAASLALSFVILYGTSFLIYGLGLPHYSYFAVTAGCLVLLALSFRDLLGLLRHHVVCRQIKAFAVLFVWGLLLMGLVRHFSGGLWSGDWLEHYERSLFFLGQLPRDYQFADLYPLPARPPLMNLVAAHFLAQAGTGYPLFQVTFLFLNLLVFFPLSLMLPVFARDGRRRLPLLVGLLLANPLLWQNATFTWTKLFTGFYVVLGLWLYLAGWRKRDPVRTAGAFLSLSAGFLAHFSAGPYALALGLHYLLFVFPLRQGRWHEALAAGLLSAALLATWFAWSAAVYGPALTFQSNTTAAELGQSSVGGTLAKVGRNIGYSLVPHPLHCSQDEFEGLFQQPSALGWYRDYLFLIYQTNLVFGMGSVGGPVILYLLARTLFGRSLGGPERRFWLLFVVVGTLAGIAAHPTLDRFGVMHVCGQPMALLGVTFLAARYPRLPLLVRWLVLAGCVIDFILGIALHFFLENRVFRFVLIEDRVRFPLSGDVLSTPAMSNYVTKVTKGLTYWGDYFTGFQGLITAALALGFFTAMVRMSRFVLRSAGGAVGGNPMTGGRRIYHIVPRSVWEQTADLYRTDSLAVEGFIHCSNLDQAERVANQFYAGQADLLVLCIDAGRLGSPVRDEGVGERFPHVYGPIE